MASAGTEWRVPLNDLRRAHRDEAAEVDAAVARTLASGWYSEGVEVRAFESELAAHLGAADAVGVGNGTDALEIALRALDPTSSTTVLTAANAGMYATSAALAAGFPVAFADVDADTLVLTPETIDAALDAAELDDAALDNPIGIVVVTHLYGRLADIAEITRRCHARGVRVVEDCAQAFGAFGPTGHAGTVGDVGTFSFYPTKNLGAYGDGGAIVTNDADIADRVRSLRRYGWSDKYHAVVPGGRNSRLDELQAAILRVRLPLVAAANEFRRSVIARYVAAAEGTPIRVLPAIGTQHAAHLAVALIETRDAAQAHFTRHGIATEVHYPVPDYLQPAIADRYRGVNCEATEAACRHVLTLPCFPQLTDDEIDLVCQALRSYEIGDR